MADRASMFRGRLPGELVRISTQSPNWGAKATFKMSEAQGINTDLAKGRRKGFVASFFMRFRYGVTVPNGGAATYYNTKRQRATQYFISVDQPNVERAWWVGELSAACLWQMSQTANLPASRLASYFPTLRGELPPGLVAFAGGSLTNAGQPDDSLFAASQWGDLAERGVCLNSGGGAVDQSIDDIIPLAPTLASRRPLNDVSPLHYWSDDSTPVNFYARVPNPTGTGYYPAGSAIVGAAAGPTVDLYAWIIPFRADRDPSAYGMHYAFRQTPREGPLVKFDPHRTYKFAGLFPQYDVATLDDGLKYGYQPYSWPGFTADTALMRWKEKIGKEWEDTWPLLFTSGDKNLRRNIVDLYNRLVASGWELGEPHDSLSPMVFPVDPSRASSLISDRLAGMLTWAALNLGGKGLGNILGAHSFSPVYPFALSSSVEDGLPGFPSVATDCEPRLLIEPTDDRPSITVTEITENPAMFETLKAKDASAPGCECNAADGGVIMKPALSNPDSNVASIVADRVPLVGVKLRGITMNARIPEAPPGKGMKRKR